MDGKERRVKEVLRRLKFKYKDLMRTSLSHTNPWELTVATILSAQSQDRQVDRITGALFKKYKRVGDYSRLKPADLYLYIRSIGLYRNKAKNIVNAAKTIQNEFGSRVPRSIGELVTIPGVGRKTANVILSDAFGLYEGIAIDTHCITVANRLGLVRSRNPAKIENRLMEFIPEKDWGDISHLFIALGRDVCTARTKYCERCVLNDICPSSTVR